MLDEFWRCLAKNLKREGITNIPSRLEHGFPVRSLWNDPGLLFTQCCGYDVVNRYVDLLAPIAVPHFSAPGCSGPEYSSFIVVRNDNPATDIFEMRESVAVINGPESHSGMGALRHLVASRSKGGKFFSKIMVSGSHCNSMEFIESGKADIAPIDCVTYALLERHRPRSISALRVLGTTYQAPAPPYVIRKADEEQCVERFWLALSQTYGDPNLQSVRQDLFLGDVERVTIEHYEKIQAFEVQAAGFNYPVLK